MKGKTKPNNKAPLCGLLSLLKLSSKEYDAYIENIFRKTKTLRVNKVVNKDGLTYALDKRGKVISIFGPRSSKVLKQMATNSRKRKT